MCSRVHGRTPQAVDVRSRTQENIQLSNAGHFFKVTIKKVDIHMCSRVHVRTPQAVDIRLRTPENM